MEQSQNEQARVEQAYALTEQDHRAMAQLAGEMDTMAAAARADWLRAAQASAEAARNFGRASSEYAKATKDYESAARTFRRITTTLMVAAASDLFLHGVCGPNVSTSQYRRELGAAGIELNGKDIDHIVARSRGGPDRPWNYMPLESSINRSLQAGGLGWKLANYPLETLNALAKNASYQLLCR